MNAEEVALADNFSVAGSLNSIKITGTSQQQLAQSTVRFFYLSNARLKWAKNQTNAKQHPEAELSLFKDSSSTKSSKNNGTYEK